MKAVTMARRASSVSDRCTLRSLHYQPVHISSTSTLSSTTYGKRDHIQVVGEWRLLQVHEGWSNMSGYVSLILIFSNSLSYMILWCTSNAMLTRTGSHCDYIITILHTLHYIFCVHSMSPINSIYYLKNLPMKLRYPSPPRECVRNLIILCSAIPRSIIIDGPDTFDMLVYISASINQNANVLSPTSAWSWLSQYAMFFSPWRRFVRVCTMSLIFHSLSDLCFKICNKRNIGSIMQHCGS